MKKIYGLLCFAALFFFLQGCYKDKGNYEYLSLDEILIDTTGGTIQADYAVYRYDTLEIAPKIFFNGEAVSSEQQVADKIDFTWTIFPATVGGAILTTDTLSHNMALDVPITKPAGKWIVSLTVKDLATQVETYQRFNLDVSEVLSDGWMVLYEREGTTDVGLIVDDRVKKGVLTSRLFLDLIKSGNGVSLAGKPVAIVHSVAPLSSGEVLVASEQNVVGVDKSSFEETYLFSDLFWTPPTQQSVKFLVGNMYRKELVINNNRIHAANFASSGVYRTNRFGTALNGSYGELENWAATYYGSTYDAVVYDKTNKKFLYVPANGTAVTDFPEQVSTTAFDVANVGMDMKAFDWGLTNYEYSIMSDNTGSYLLVSNFMGTQTNVGLRKIDMSTSPEITAVTTMASAYAGQYVLYGAGTHVYNFKYNSGLDASLAWSAPAGEEVTCVRLQKFYYPQMQLLFLPLPNQVVYIATWNETTKQGKVYSYPIDASSGSIDETSERVTTGYGKVKDMGYKWNL